MQIQSTIYISVSQNEQRPPCTMSEMSFRNDGIKKNDALTTHMARNSRKNNEKTDKKRKTNVWIATWYNRIEKTAVVYNENKIIWILRNASFRWCCSNMSCSTALRDN